MATVHYYRDLGTLAVWVKALLAVQLVLALLAALAAWSHGPGYSKETGSDFYALIALLQAITYVVGGILALRWIYLACANSHAFCAQGLGVKPVMAVVWYFVPIASLVMPFKTMSETWKVARSHGGDWEAERTPLLLIGWWAAWLIGNIVGLVALRLSFQGLEGEAAGETITPISDLISALAIALFLVIVARITAMQRETAKAGALAPLMR